MKKGVFAAVLFLFACAPSMAVEWLCSASASTRVAIASADHSEEFTLAQAPSKKPQRFRIYRSDLMQAYSGQPVLLGSAWLLVVMLPSNHPDTIAAFGELGISPVAAERMAADTGLVDRRIRVVQSPSQMLDKVSSNPPAVGYTGFFLGARDVAPCF